MNQLLSSRLTSSVVAIAIVLLVVLLNAVVIINPGQAGVLSILGKAQDTPLLEGIHWKPPFIASVNVYDVTVQKFEVPAESATKDLQDITASFAINFRLDPMAIVDVRRTQGTLENIVAKIIAPQTQEAFKIAAARRTAEEAITKRDELKEDFDHALSDRLAKYHILVLDTSVVNLDFSEEFSKAVEDKQIAEQRAQRAVYIAQEAAQQAQAEINRAQGKAEAQRLLAETLKAPGGQLVLQKEAIEAWREGGAQVPQVIVLNGQEGLPPFLLNWSAQK
ncbi:MULTISPECIES: prohibitin family protein [unclassified Thermosynechococcus]|uniref:prohibitin family protein n=1 Tax=unclassified Thermosynechococcus TaxID=2622553 RepID=UPI0019ED1831|nr:MULTISPECIES: prohibitin family protein [unclassified Thermosynechococcus]HIK34596.1 prohibitin family protein [Thermosynechococcus sp. M98_K2018_005]HIK47025.1 prohibitin family protein [Thermosynechococcus sp. M55_K2018_012]